MNNLSRSHPATIIAVLVISWFFRSCDNNDDSNSDERIDPNTIASSSLIAWFPFDSEPAAGSPVSYTNNTIRFVTKIGSGAFVDGQRGRAYQGNASKSGLEYDVLPETHLADINEFTITCWLKSPATVTGSARIFSLNGGDSLLGNLALTQESQPEGDSLDMKLFLYDALSTGWRIQEIRKNKKEFLNDKWFHMAALYRKNSSVVELYSNGKKVHSQVLFSGPVFESGQSHLGEIRLKNNMSKIYFGAWPQQVKGNPDGWMTYFGGLVDEFRIYNKALSEEEVRDLYNAELSQVNNP